MLSRPLILASKSPRRAELLRTVGWQFEVLAANIDESRHANEPSVDYVRRLAQTKAATVAGKLSDGMVLGADTIVVVENEILGQPQDEADARRMLRLLSSKWHEVFTGVALVDAAMNQTLVEHQITRVCFADISEAEIEWYISTTEPNDKAGAYAIQGHGAVFIEAVEGDYFNIVGLPIRLVYQMMLQLNSAAMTSSTRI